MKRALSAVALCCALLVAACGGSTHSHPAAQHGGRVRANSFIRGAKSSAGLSFPRGLTFSATPSLAGYDAVTISNVPHGAQVVGCYATGTYANCGAAQIQFPSAHRVSITPTASFVPATCLDTEPGDSTPDQVAGWIRSDHAHGIARPCDYANASEMVQVQADLRAAGLPRSSYLLWVAAWDGNPAIPAGFDAHQWYSDAAIDKDTFSSAFFPAVKPRGPICFGHGWEHTAFCNGVRQQDATRGRKIKLENGYIRVSQHNVATFGGRLSIEQKRLAAINTARAILHGVGQNDPLLNRLAVRYVSEVKLSGHSLAVAQGRLKVEQSRAATDNAQLAASLKKYGGS